MYLKYHLSLGKKNLARVTHRFQTQVISGSSTGNSISVSKCFLWCCIINRGHGTPLGLQNHYCMITRVYTINNILSDIHACANERGFFSVGSKINVGDKIFSQLSLKWHNQMVHLRHLNHKKMHKYDAQ